MKKIYIFIMITLLLFGCSFTDMDNTPIKKVEKYMNNYQILTTDVLDRIDSIATSEVNYTEEQIDEYKSILKKHFTDMMYEVKDETINGDIATVEVEIEVTDYTKTLNDVGIYKQQNLDEFTDESEFIDYKLEELKNTKDKVKYTLYLSLVKQNDEWTVDNLTNEDETKLLGIYKY